jgi:hypothetical protein
MFGTEASSNNIRKQIVSHVVQNWESFKLMSHDEHGDNYSSAAVYLSKMSKCSTFGGYCELYAAGQIFDYVFEVYRDRCLQFSFGRDGNPIKRLRFSGNLSSGHFDVYVHSSISSLANYNQQKILKEKDATCKRRKRAQENAYEKKARQEKDATCKRSKKAQENAYEKKARQEKDATRKQLKKAQENAYEKKARQEKDATRKQLKKAQENAYEKKARQEKDATRKRLKRAQENAYEKKAHQQKDTEHKRGKKLKKIDATEQRITHNCGSLNVICKFCGAKHFVGEKPPDGKFTSCCRKGKVALSKPLDIYGNELIYPSFLRDLMSNPANVHHKNFRQNIRSYNSAVSFASMGAKVINFSGRGPYVFKVHGQICHQTSHLQPIDGNTPKFAQLYVLDSTQATKFRVSHPANEQCLTCILDDIDRFFRQNNRLCHTYHMLREIEAQALEEAQQAAKDIPIVNLVFRRDRQSDKRRYNEPTHNEIAMVFVNDDGEPPFERDLRIYPHNPRNRKQQFVNINILSPNLDPMCYPLFFPFGEPGWQPNWTCDAYEGVQKNKIRINVTMLQYKAALLAIRGDFNPILSGGKLTQQYIVDSYLQVEANNLNFIRTRQNKLRTELYQGLADHVEQQEKNSKVPPGIPVILPSSFEGSPRNMRERCADAMSIFGKFGPPDVFVTFTANPKWPEITENLQICEEPHDRPDLIARVFNLKLKALLEDITTNGVLGISVAYVYTIEFQKRGLPHAHLLFVLRSEDKLSTPEMIDRVVCAEIPDQNKNPGLYDIVIRCMMHGPCGVDRVGAPCMEEGKCNKNFPKDYQSQTVIHFDGYPLYRRRVGASSLVRGAQMDNRFVVPYNPYLLMKYDAHINVEVCTSVRAVKYIYKYIYKGYDCANLVVSAGEVQQNEIANYIGARYVSAPEAMWRLLECKMHDRSHAVHRLPVHLPNQQKIVFTEGREEEALQLARSGRTKLEAWFDLNKTDVDAKHILYTDIPYDYVFVGNKWQKRKRVCKIVARIYIVSAKDEERFYLRMLLLHVPGATSFQFLRTVDNVVYDSFKEAAFHRHLLNSDEEWYNCLQEASVFQMPKQLRQTFSFILIFCSPTNSLNLWNKYSREMSIDFFRNSKENEALNFALHDINTILKQHGMSCANFGLPMPTGTAFECKMYDKLKEEQEANERIGSLNEDQLQAFNTIRQAVENECENNRYFYLDGPGGSGKTFLYCTLLSFIRGKGKVALPFATTGIAATLLRGGRTVHSGFKLPVPLLDSSVSSMKANSPDAELLEKAVLIIIDEITMLTKEGIRCIDLLLKEIMKNDKPFGGKVIVIGGDFRQTLPVVSKGNRTQVIESCIKSSPLWSVFTQLTLRINMRSAGEDSHNKWLLSIGGGTLSQIEGLPYDSVEIPSHMVENNIVHAIYTENFKNMDTEDMAKRIILSPTNKKTLQINQEIISGLEGNAHTYNSVDTIVSEDDNDVQNYPPEFLHGQTPSGMPPHKLVLKKGVIIMLLRNLNPKQGLCNGSRLSVMELHENFITARILSECNKGDIVFISRIDLAPSDINLPFILKRRQLPIIPAYAMTINKAQGQTFDHVGIYLPQPVFSHGQLYVAVTRCRNPNNLKFCIKETDKQGKITKQSNSFTANVVYREVFSP